jgi:hypothetical protein
MFYRLLKKVTAACQLTLVSFYVLSDLARLIAVFHNLFGGID